MVAPRSTFLPAAVAGYLGAMARIEGGTVATPVGTIGEIPPGVKAPAAITWGPGSVEPIGHGIASG